MHRFTFRPAGAAAFVVSLVLVACAPALGDAETPTPSSPPSASPEPSETPRPSGGEPSPSLSPTQAPSPTAEPATPIVRHPVSTYGRATADGVAVRVLPGLLQPLIDQEVFETREILCGVRLDAGDPVVIVMGPVLVDGIGWYQVHDNDGDRVSWLTSGWVAGQYLDVTGPMEDAPVTVAFDGLGVDVTASGDVAGGYPLVYNIMAAPLDGADACELAVSLIVDGAPIEGVEVTVSEPTMVWQSQLENAELFTDGAGTAEISVKTDCSIAGFLREVTQG